jgi:UDP-hydrolysing UDP-N-acetyl-D-glucosamine 2-epimerase
LTPRKVCVVVTARPSYARIKTALEAIRDHADLELQLVVGASALLDRYGNVVDVMIADGFTPDARVYMVVEGENVTTMAKSTGLGLVELSTTLDNLQPDLVLTVADRFETLATAIAASYMNIPTVHLQGGEVTGSIDEKVRHAVTKLADAHFVCTALANERVVRMGEREDRVWTTGCPSIDLAARIAAEASDGFDPMDHYTGVGADLDLSNGYVVVLQHPVTTEHAQARHQAEETLHAIAALGMPSLWFWPNVDAGSDGTSRAIRRFRELEDASNMHFYRNMTPEDFLRVARKCSAIVGNSSVAIRECSYLGVPAVNIGHRQEGRERGANVVDVGHDRAAILDATRAQVANGRYAADHTYGDAGAGGRIAELLATIEVDVVKRLTY